MNHDTLSALILGALEGFTEFLPISSTGHLILAGDLLGFQSEVGKLFEIVIQLGAILAVVVFSIRRLWDVVVSVPNNPGSRRFAWAILVAFLPAAALGALLHDFIKTVLFSSWVVVTTLILGGVAILVFERLAPKPRYCKIEAMPYEQADVEGTKWRSFVALWWERHRGAEVGITHLYPLALSCDPPLPIGDSSQHSQRVRLGKAMARMRDRVFEIDGLRLRIQIVGERQHAHRWRLAQIHGPN